MNRKLTALDAIAIVLIALGALLVFQVGRLWHNAHQQPRQARLPVQYGVPQPDFVQIADGVCPTGSTCTLVIIHNPKAH